MRIILLSLITLLFVNVSAQELATDTITHKGKSCYVYPYNFEWKKPYRGRKYFQENADIPPIFDSLPSGNYVMLHAFKPTFRNKRKNKRGKLKPIVGAEFSVENGKLNGKVVYYDYNGQKRKEGYFKNGLKDGEWLYISSYYSIEKKKEVPYLSGICSFKDGLEEGLQKELNAIGKPVEEYIKKGKGFVKYYKVFYRNNGQTFIDVRADSVTELNRIGLWPLQFAGSLVYDTAVTVIDFSKMTPKQLKQYRKTYGYKRFYDNYDNDYYINNYYSGYQIPSEIPFVAYHENGEVLGRFSGVSSLDKWSLQFDTIYNPLKKPALIKVPLPDSNDHVRFRLDYYKPTGALVKQTYYVLDSMGEYKNYRRDKVVDGKMQMLKADFSYFYSSDWKGKKLDSLYLLSVEKSTYGSTTTFEYMSPKIPFKKFVNEVDSATGFKKYYTILKYDTSVFQYKITADLGRISVHGFYHCDTSQMAVLRLENVLNRFLLGDEEAYYEEEEVEQYRTVLDSMQLFVDGKAFTGNVIASYGKGEEAFTFKDGNVLFDVNARIGLIEFGVYGPDFKLTIAFKNGRIQSINDKGKKFESNFTFNNNMGDGKSTGYIKKGGKKRLAFEINTIDGQYHGVAKSYAYMRKKQEKDDQKYYLSHLQHFNSGVAIDTHAYYYPDGTFERLNVYNQKGELNGNNINFYRDGSISWFSNYVDGKLEGILYEINGIGDTVTKGFFIGGLEEGKYHQEHYDYEQEIYDFRLTCAYHKGKLNGDLTLKDSYNTLRLELKIDSGYPNGGSFNYINEQTILNDWRSDLAFTGEVNVYHPNGKKYLNGRMLMATDTLPGGAYSYGTNKVGVWTYYNTVERKVAELNFVNDAQLVFGADTLFGTAYYKAFYPNGSIKYLGVLNYEDTRLNCATDIQESDFVATYSTFLSAEGDTLVKNGTGNLKLYNLDGNVIAEGDVKNGLKNGWWKTYNDEGKLIEVGQYINDQKDGRWLSGDLTGINYLDPQCFENEEKKQEKQELEKDRIEIEEIIYDKGEELSSQSYEFTRTR